MLTVEVRKYIYLVLIAAFPVACFYFPALVPAAPLWLALLMAVLNLKPQDVEAVPVFAKEADEQEPDWEEEDV